MSKDCYFEVNEYIRPKCRSTRVFRPSPRNTTDGLSSNPLVLARASRQIRIQREEAPQNRLQDIWIWQGEPVFDKILASISPETTYQGLSSKGVKY